jgi:translation initiation factor IF-3
LRIADKLVRVNERIRAREVRVVDDEGQQLGIMPPFEALKVARERGLDLVEVSPTANPPVCRVINYGKYLYQLNKRQHEARKHQRSVELKEVKFRPRTSEHDFDTKRNHIVEFLKSGSKVKATIMFRGREMAHRDLGWHMMDRLIKALEDVGQTESRPKQEGPNLSAIIAPKKVATKTSKPAAQGSGGVAKSQERAKHAPASGVPAAQASAPLPPAALSVHPSGPGRHDQGTRESETAEPKPVTSQS